MIRHVIAMTAFAFPEPDFEDLEFGGYLDTVTTTFTWYPDEPDKVTLTTDRQDKPGQFAPYDFPREYIEHLMEFSVGGNDSDFVLAIDEGNPEWVFVNQLDRPPVYAQLGDIEFFLDSTYLEKPETVAFDDSELDSLLKGSA
jgi:hypothetical protein